MGEMFAELVANDARRAVAARINDRVQATEHVMTLAEEMQLALMAPTLGDLTRAEQEASLDRMREGLQSYRADVALSMNVMLSFTYRDFSIEELQAYEAFLESPAVAKFYAHTSSELLQHWRRAFAQVGAALTPVVAELVQR